MNNETHYFGTCLSARAIGEEYLGTIVDNRFVRACNGEAVAIQDSNGDWYDLSDHWLPDAYMYPADDGIPAAYNTAD